MTIFKYELRQTRILVVAWAVICAMLLFATLPGFIGIVIDESSGAKTNVLESVETNSFLKAVDVSADFLSKPIGMYGFITGWLFGLAFAVVAVHIGLSIHIKEYMFKSADFLLTKPFSRSRVFTEKLLAAATDILIIGAVFWVTSLVAMNIYVPGFDFKLFMLLSIAPILNMTLYLAVGIFIGMIAPKTRKPLLVSVLVMFVTVMIGTLAQVTDTDILLFLSPPKFFGGSIVAAAGGYDMRFVVWIIFLDIALLGSSFIIYRKKDIVTV